ncbi:membrane-targeted effector domain-containing toxin [Pseudomonas sp. QTF5]|uniref:membrane-targeted effector domain-containing toxin n=1 Tax=Pseudomonas sp. QTF5 TaxID=1435425 RepID=UPI0004B609B2|nr:membrane-targeted effector domain-containing toxin [Pseudomonas sp. QTF5]
MNPSETRPLPNAADKAALKAIATTVIQTCPGLQDTAHEVASDLLKKYGIVGLDPDRVYFHRFQAAQSNSKTFTGWEHVNEPASTPLSLTQLVIQRFRATDQDNADLLDLYGGFYTAGPEAGDFDEKNEVRLHGNEVLKDFWNINFSDLYTARLTTFWERSASDFRTLTKCNFLINAVQARDKRQLSDDDFNLVVNAVMGPITWPISLQQLQTEHPDTQGRVRTLDVDGYVATNTLRIVAPKGRQIVYLPGETNAFQVLETATDMHFWMFQRMNTEDARQAFMTHFALADRQKIAENITDIMNRLVKTWGKYDHHMINQKNQIIQGDAFSWLRDSTKEAMFAEAELALTSNGDLRKKLWIGYLSAGLKVFGPMAVVGWPIALPVVGASIANMGLNIDQAVNAKTADERKAGILGAVLSGIDLLFNLLVLKGPGTLPEIGPEVDAAEATEMTDLIESTQPVKGTGPATDLEVTAPRTTPSSAKVPQSGLADTEALAGELTDDVLVPALPMAAQGPTVPDNWQANELLEGLTPVSEPGNYQGIYRLDSEPSTAIMMNDAAYYVRFEGDINGEGHWMIINPEFPNRFPGSIPVRLNAEGNWGTMPRSGLKGGGKTPGLAGTSAQSPVRLPDSPYEVPQHLRAELEVGADGHEPYALRDEYDSLKEFDPHREFKAIRKRLYQDAVRFYENPDLPPRPPIPQLAQNATAEEIIDATLEHARGLVIGESHSDIGSKQFLIDNMELLARKKVKTLYMEHLLTDFHQADLDTFAETHVMSIKLEKYLRGLDIGQMTDPLGRYTFLELVKEAGKHRIRVQAIDSMASYRVEGMTFLGPQGRVIDETVRQKMMNYFARTIIRTDQAMRGAHKWVALMGNTHSNTYEGLAGISELEEGIGIRVEDVAEGTETGVDIDPGRRLPLKNMPHSPTAVVKGDLRLRVEVPWGTQNLQEIEALLPRAGMYTLKQEPGATYVMHRSRAKELVRTVIQEDGDRYYIERPQWASVSGKRFGSIRQLLQALDNMGMALAGWSKPL